MRTLEKLQLLGILPAIDLGIIRKMWMSDHVDKLHANILTGIFLDEAYKIKKTMIYSNCCGTQMSGNQVLEEKCPECEQYCDLVESTPGTYSSASTPDPKPAEEEEHPELNVSEG